MNIILAAKVKDGDCYLASSEGYRLFIGFQELLQVNKGKCYQ